MRILHLYAPYDPPLHGGIQRVVGVLSRGQARAGHEAVVLCASLTRETWRRENEGVTLVHAAMRGRVAGHRFVPAMAGLLRDLAPGLVHLHTPSPPAELAWLMARLRCPLVVGHYCDVTHRGWRRLYAAVYQRVLRGAGRVVVNAPQMLRANPVLEPHLRRCRVQPLGLELAPLAESGRSREVTARLRATHPGPVSLYLGRFHAYKGLEVLAEAMRSVPGTLLLCGGGRGEGALRARVTAMGLARRVRFEGDVADEDLSGYYRAADVFVLPSTSRAEAFGLSMLEAMACGVPVVSTRLGTGTSFVNQDGVTGLEVEPRNAAALAGAMNRLLADRDGARRFGEAARIRASKLTAESMIQGMQHVYTELLEEA